MNDEVESRAENMQEKQGSVADAVRADKGNLVGVTWRGGRKVEKNLILKTSAHEKKATYVKDEVSQALIDTQITDSRFTNGGSIVMSFDNENKRAWAAKNNGAC